MRRVKVIGHGVSEAGEIVEVARRDYRLMRAVVREAETLRKDRECTIVLARALDAFNKGARK